MKAYRWSWVGASSIGTSHLRAGTGCDDSGACLEFQTGQETALIAVVSDGAGSAAHASRGARIVVGSICRSASTFLAAGGQAKNIEQETVAEWLDDVRDRIEHAARLQSSPRRAFAATLVACVVQRAHAAVVHVGDGACVLRLRGTKPWLVPSWPAQGEYASTTYFVTDDPTPHTSLAHVEGEVEELAIFSDGLERLALDFGARTAFEPFFESMFPPLRAAPSGRQRRLSTTLRAFLDGRPVTERTDDDKTLIMARRM